ncbi:hypothetical protein ABGB18_31735 [Nonomuraea sp. B12E4]|uniref:hypothetical protein n=1 Tax=Nonomuraea sp. B12E4 TaxID=3153564 RepID=UPI00325DE1F4
MTHRKRPAVSGDPSSASHNANGPQAGITTSLRKGLDGSGKADRLEVLVDMSARETRADVTAARGNRVRPSRPAGLGCARG